MKSALFALCLGLVLALSGASPARAFEDLDLEKLRQQARQGNPVAQTKLGVIHARGLKGKIEIDKQKAAEWYTRAADQDYATGQWNLAFMYVRGEGVEEDQVKARELFLQAAEQDYAPAQYDLGMMHLYGMGGKRSRTQALEWIRRAAAQDYREAVSFLRSQGEYSSTGKERTEPSAETD